MLLLILSLFVIWILVFLEIFQKIIIVVLACHDTEKGHYHFSKNLDEGMIWLGVKTPAAHPKLNVECGTKHH